MAEKKEETVNLIAPNGLTVSVAESKLAERIHGGYRLAASKPKTSAKK